MVILHCLSGLEDSRLTHQGFGLIESSLMCPQPIVSVSSRVGKDKRGRIKFIACLRVQYISCPTSSDLEMYRPSIQASPYSCSSCASLSAQKAKSEAQPHHQFESPYRLASA